MRTERLLIRDATLIDGRHVDVLIEHGRVAAVGRGHAAADAPVIDAGGGLLLPGLQDHHLHLAAEAAARASVRCGPPDVTDAAGLAAALAAAPGDGWLRSVGYHDGVAGAIDRRWLDAVVPGRPVRIQHRSGRLWILNSAALDRLLASGLAPPERLERRAADWTGRLYEGDEWLRRAMRSAPPDLANVGDALSALGVTGVTDMSPANDDRAAAHLAEEHGGGALPQRVTVAGAPSLGARGLDARLALGPVKLHLHEAHLPDLATTVATVHDAHAAGRAVAVHCVTLVELLFTLAVLRDAGPLAGDRIEHASIAPEPLIADIAALGVAVVTQPNFVAERGDAYLEDVAAEERPDLYRLRSWLDAGVTLAGGSDAPFGRLDPWAAMTAAISRRTAAGATIGAEEALTPEAALALFLADPADLTRIRRIAPGAVADLCLLRTSWPRARERLSADLVAATVIGGRIVHQRVHETPGERGVGGDALAR